MPSELTPTRSRLVVVRRGATLGCETSPVAVRHPVSPGERSVGVGGAGVALGMGVGVGKGVGLGVGLCLGVGLGVGERIGLGVGEASVATATMRGAGFEYLPVSGVALATRQ
jgi:hypothetical protein